MGLVTPDDGWRGPDELWQKLEPLLPPRPTHPLGCHRPEAERLDLGTGAAVVVALVEAERLGALVRRGPRERNRYDGVG